MGVNVRIGEWTEGGKSGRGTRLKCRSSAADVRDAGVGMEIRSYTTLSLVVGVNDRKTCEVVHNDEEAASSAA